MRSNYSILKLGYKPVSVAGGVRKAVGGFLRYLQFRKQPMEHEAQGGLDAHLRYLAHRDRTSPGGRVFGREGALTSGDRRRLVEYVARSTHGLSAKWVKGRNGELEDRQRAVYEMVISPDDWQGLDLRRIARAAMTQLEADAGVGGIGPWFAAEHHNTDHHHVQIVLAARREVAPGKFSTLLITRARLQRMKEALWREIERQRGLEREPGDKVLALRPSSHNATRRSPRHDAPRWRWSREHAAPAGVHLRPITHARHRRLLGATLQQLRTEARQYRRRMEHELEEELVRGEREGWSR